MSSIELDVTLLLLFALMTFKFFTGVAVSLKATPREFKAFYIGRILRFDGLLFIAIVLFAYATHGNAAMALACYETLFGLHLAAAIVKNIAHLNKRVGDHIPSIFREPTRLRLGNVKNLPS